MRTLILLVCLVSPLWAQEVVKRGEVLRSYEVVLEGQQPYLVCSFTNRGSRTLELGVPAGVLFVGQREPCLPVLSGRAVSLRLGPGQSRSVRIQALSLSAFPHTPGPYSMAPAPTYEDEYVRAGAAVNRVWKKNASGSLRADPLRLAQLAVFLLGEQMPAEQVRSLASPDEWAQLQTVLR